MGKCKILQGGGSTISNAVVGEYYSETGTIKSNMFLQYVATRTLKTTIANVKEDQVVNWVAEPVSDHRFLLYYSTSDKQIYASLCEINSNNTVSVLNTVLVGTVSSSGYFTGMVKLSENKFFCTLYSARAVILTVSEDTIQVGTITDIVPNHSCMKPYVHMAVVRSNIVVIPFFDGSTSGFYNQGAVATIKVEGTSISTIEVVALGATFPYPYQGSNNIECVALSEDKVCVVSGALSGTDSAPQIRGTVITIDANGKMTVGTTNTIMNNNGYTGLAASHMDDTHFVLAWSVSSTVTQIGVVTVGANNTLSIGTRLSLTGTGYWDYDITLTKYDESTYLLTTRASSSSGANIYCYALALSADNVFSQLSRSNLELTVSSSSLLYDILALPALSGFFLMLGYQNATGIWAQAFSLEAKTICKPYVDTVYGVSKTRATASVPGKVMVPSA